MGKTDRTIHTTFPGKDSSSDSQHIPPTCGKGCIPDLSGLRHPKTTEQIPTCGKGCITDLSGLYRNPRTTEDIPNCGKGCITDLSGFRKPRTTEHIPICGNGCITDLSGLYKDSRITTDDNNKFGYNNFPCGEADMNGSLLDQGSFGRNVKSGLITLPVNGTGTASKTCEVWCICRVLKPCHHCGGVRTRSEDRDVTPTPEISCSNPTERDSNCPTPTQEVFNRKDLMNGVLENGDLDDGTGKDNDRIKVNGEVGGIKGDNKLGKRSTKGDNCGERGKFESSASSKCGNGNNQLSDDELSDLQDLFAKLHEIQDLDTDDADDTTPTTHMADKDHHRNNSNVGVGGLGGGGGGVKVNGHMATPTGTVPDTPTSVLDTPMSAMDTASICSFDHFDFDTSSFCSLKSTDTMEQGDLADQLSMVQQMVMEMKTGFARAVEELSKIQYGDQNLQQQLADNRQECSDEIGGVKTSLDQLKAEVQRLNGQVQDISAAQRSLQDKVESYQSDKLILLEELERNGAISDQSRVRLSGGPQREANNNNVPGIPVGPMVHPYLNSLQNHHQHLRGQDEMYHSDSSLTAAVSRSLNLTQALGEKCLNLDFSTTSSDDEENSRHSHSGSGHNKPIRRHRSFQFDEVARNASKVAPHEHMLEEVHREESARDIVEAEREYCAQVWSLLEDFMSPVRESEVVGARDFAQLFPVYVPQLYEQHCVILRKMEERLKKWRTAGVIGDVFAKFTETKEGEGLSLYKEFINDFPTIIGTMNKWFTHSPHFRELMQSPCLANSPVLPLLLAPLQQVPKYSLLLKGLLKYTPADHPDRYYLESSLNHLKHFLNEMNEDLEHAMQVINSNNQPIPRAREFSGHSGHSRSSGSSVEVTNHLSRDSGIHSTEEDREKSPASPNTTRRYLIQVLREKRERELYQGQGQGSKQESNHPSTPRGRKDLDYGSHPDLTHHHQQGYSPDGRVSPYLASLPQSKMFSSLSKLPLPKNKGSRSSNKGPAINPNYLRPLTPQAFPSSTSAHNFDSARRREELTDRARRRPASAVEFGYNGQVERSDHFYDILAQQAGLAISPPNSSSSERSRRDLQLSLQKLLAETNNAAEFSDNEQDEPDAANQGPSYHKQFLDTKDKIMGQPDDDGDYNKRLHHNPQHLENHGSDSPNVEDYGVYGDDDDDDDEGNDEHSSKVKPMRLLPDTHRPKIMVPRWRQNTSPQPPSYNKTVENMSKPKTNSKSEENLAASLAQSLLEGRSPNNPASPTVKEQKVDAVNKHGSGIPTSTNSLKRRLHHSVDVPKASSSEPRRSLSDKLNPGVSGKVVSRPADLKLNHTNSGAPVPVTVDQSEHDEDNNVGSTNLRRPNSVTRLSDVIAYTADCIEKKENGTSELSIPNSGDTQARPASFTIGSGSNEKRAMKRASLQDITKHLKVSSVDADNISLSNSDSDSTSMSKPTGDFKISFAVSSNTAPLSKSPVNTESVVNYFQSKGQQGQEKTDTSVDSPNKTNRIPTFISMNKTSTPITENPFQIGMSKSKDSFPGFSKKESGRLVRGDNVKEDRSVVAKSESVDTRDQSGEVTKDQPREITSESSIYTRESVLQNTLLGVNRTLTSIVLDQGKSGVRDQDTTMDQELESSTMGGLESTTKRELEINTKGEAVTKGDGDGTATKESVLRAVDKLRTDLERQKQQSKERKLSKASSLTPASSIEPSSPTSPTPTSPTTPSSASIQRHFNQLSGVGKYSKPDDPEHKPLTLKSFSPTPIQNREKQSDGNMSSFESDSKSSDDLPEQRQGIYKKAGQLKAPTKYPTDISASARQIQRLERSASPSGRSPSPNNHTNDYEKFKTQVESTVSKPTKRGSSPHRGIRGVFAPTRSKSPVVSALVQKERPKSTTGIPSRSAQSEMNGDGAALKSAMKDTRIPVLRKAGSPPSPSLLSKSSEDISKLKKKSAFKDQLKNIFGRKKKKSKLYNTPYDPDEAYNNHVMVDRDALFPLTPERRSNSTSQILQSYVFEEEDDVFADDPISAV